jgi:hypothetical protein
MTGVPTLDFDGAANLSLVFDGITTLNLAAVTDTTLEIWVNVDGIGHAGDVTLLRRLLEANHVGEGTHSARLSLAPGQDQVVLCERLVITELSDAAFGERIIGFLKLAMFWQSPDALKFMAAAPSATTGELDVGSFMIRA